MAILEQNQVLIVAHAACGPHAPKWREEKDMFFATDWGQNYQHFSLLADAIFYARHLGPKAVVYGPAGEVVWFA